MRAKRTGEVRTTNWFVFVAVLWAGFAAGGQAPGSAACPEVLLNEESAAKLTPEALFDTALARSIKHRGGNRRRVVWWTRGSADTLEGAQQILGRYGIEVLPVPVTYEGKEPLLSGIQKDNVNILGFFSEVSTKRPAGEECVLSFTTPEGLLLTYTHLIPENERSSAKVTPLAMALSKYVVDRISYTMPRTFRGKPSRIANVVDLTYDTASFFQTLGGVFTSTAESLVHWALNDGLFLREPKNRRQAHVYVTGLHGGVELLSRDRHAEELQYLLHDLTHELIPDLLLDEGFNTPLGRKVYVARRAASEIVAIAAEDIWSSAGKDAGTLKHAAQRVLQEYGKGLRPILVGDTHWNDRNFRAAEASAANFVNWTKKNRPLLAAYGLRRETIGEITKRLSLQKHLTWTQLLDRIFEDAFESQVAPVLSARPAKLLPVEQRRARSVVRYMAGQMAVFERFRELPETTRTEREISALLWNRTKGMEQSDAENLRSRLEEYLTFLLNSHQIDFDDYQTFRGVYPWFPPFYLRFDAYDGLTPEDILDGGGPLLAEEGTDYRIDTKDRKASVTVLAIHGGTIEPYTTELAAEIAGTNHNFYSFTGLLKERAHAQLHIGSNQFREPRAVRFMEQSAVGISVHGFYDEARLAVCIGGAHTGLGKRVATELSRALPHVAIEHPCEEFPGTSPNNIVNRAAAGGVQLELSSRLRRELRNNHPMKEAFVKAVRSAVSASPAYKE